MALREFKLPDPGEGLTEAEIVTWHVAAGDPVKVNDIVVEIETAKSLVELPVPFAGTVGSLLVAEGDTVEVGTPIITVDDGTGGADDATAPSGDAITPPGEAAVPDAAAVPEAAAVTSGAAQSSSPDVAAPAVAVEATTPAVAVEAPAPIGVTDSDVPSSAPPPGDGAMAGRTAVLVGYGVKPTEARRRPRKATATGPGSHPDDRSARHTELSAPADGQARVLAAPPVRKLARDLGVDLGAVVPTGDGGVVTRADVESATRTTPTTTAATGPDGPSGPTTRTGPRSSTEPPSAEPQGRETRVPVKGVRKMTAQAMVASAFTAPHVTEWVTIDVTRTMELVAALKRDSEFRDVKVTPLLVLAKAMCVAVRRHPGINASWDEPAREIVLKHYVNLGIAAATPRGLVVPNIKDADRMTMRELAGAIGALTETTREGRTPPADMAGGTITATNIGVFGVDAGTPIVNPGESAILAFGAVARRPWVVTDDAGVESVVPRWVTTLALSFDHRLVDGELGSRYLADVAALLENPARGLVWG
ncbi:MAG: dihydrolipoamide acetyltransferase family protein [Phycicoccus sp.]